MWYQRFCRRRLPCVLIPALLVGGAGCTRSRSEQKDQKKIETIEQPTRAAPPAGQKSPSRPSPGTAGPGVTRAAPNRGTLDNPGVIPSGKWTAGTHFIDPVSAINTELLVSVSPGGGAPCIGPTPSEKETELAFVPVPPRAKLLEGVRKGQNVKCFVHYHGVGMLHLVRLKEGARGHHRVIHTSSSESSVVSKTLVLPDNYEWTRLESVKVTDAAGRTVAIEANQWRHNIVTVQARKVSHMEAMMHYKVRATPLQKALAAAYKSCPTCVKAKADGVVVRLPENVLFASGKADLLPAGQKLLDRFLPMLRKHVSGGKKVFVEGHTDSRPIRKQRFKSNWELSTARACAVVHYFAQKGLLQTPFAAVGHAGNVPVAPNTTDEGRKKNRRVELNFKFL